jgi:hypothetical protein
VMADTVMSSDGMWLVETTWHDTPEGWLITANSDRVLCPACASGELPDFAVGDRLVRPRDRVEATVVGVPGSSSAPVPDGCVWIMYGNGQARGETHQLGAGVIVREWVRERRRG